MGWKNRFRYRKKATRAPMRQGVVEHHGAADGQQDGLAEDAQQLGARAVDGVDVGGVVVGVPVVADHVAVVDDVVALAVVGGDDPDPVEALGQVGQHVGDPVAHPVVAALRGPLEPERGRPPGRARSARR